MSADKNLPLCVCVCSTFSPREEYSLYLFAVNLWNRDNELSHGEKIFYPRDIFEIPARNLIPYEKFNFVRGEEIEDDEKKKLFSLKKRILKVYLFLPFKRKVD